MAEHLKGEDIHGSDGVKDLLRLYIGCSDAQRAKEALSALILTHATPIVEGIVASKVKPEAREDVRNTVLVDLIERLHDLRKSQVWESIHDVMAYAAVAAFHACREYYRQTNPARHQMRRRLRYLLAKHPNVGIWRGQGGDWLCGLREQWPPGLAVGHPRPARPQRRKAREMGKLVEDALQRAGAPLPLDDLLEQVGYATGAWSLSKISRTERPAHGPTIETLLSERSRLRKLWKEILMLDPLQRASLLLSMRDENGGSAIVLLPLLGIAGLAEVAETLAMPVEELSALWNELPLDDQRIGRHLGLEKQKVSNLRKSARERLSRREAVLNRTE